MKDLITLANITGLRTELLANGSVDEDGNPYLQIIKTPTIHKDGKTIALVRCLTIEDEDLINSLNSVTVLGECIENQYVFTDSNQDVYEKLMGVGKYLVPEHDEDGNEIDKPYMIGVFA